MEFLIIVGIFTFILFIGDVIQEIKEDDKNFFDDFKDDK